MSSVTANKPLTKVRIALPEPMPPVLIMWPDKGGRSGGHDQLGAVRRLDPRDLDLYLTKREKFEKLYEPTPADETKELMFIIRLADAIDARSLPKLKRALRQFIGETETEKALQHPMGFSAIRKLSMMFNKRLMYAHPTIYWSDADQRLLFALLCPDIETALYVLALQKVGIGAMGECQGCSGPLIRDRPNKHFCDNNCRARHYMRQLRARQAAQKAKRAKGKQRRAERQKVS